MNDDTVKADAKIEAAARDMMIAAVEARGWRRVMRVDDRIYWRRGRERAMLGPDARGRLRLQMLESKR